MSTQNNETNTTYQVGSTVQVAPADLLVDRNIREAQVDADFTASIKRHGVLEPVSAVVTDDGNLRVRFGHRRTLAAIKTGRETIPVYIRGHEADDDKAAGIERVTSQHDENTHRAGLTTAEKVGVVTELALFGLSPTQMAKQGIKKADAEAATAVAGSKLALAASKRYDALTLDQAATVAEFEDDQETAKALIVAAERGDFDHVAQKARTARAYATSSAQVAAALDQAGVTVVERPPYDAKTERLTRLKADATAKTALDEHTHAQCPGHVAWIEPQWEEQDKDGNPIEFPEEPAEDADEEAYEAWETACESISATSRRVQVAHAVYGCTAPTKHGHADLYSYSGSTTKVAAADKSPEEREADKKARALVIENNKAWADAETVRREWLAKFAKSKTAPKGTSAFIATALSVDGHHMAETSGNAIAADWLGKKHTGYGRADLSPAKSATEQRGYVLALVQVLADYEASLHRGSWRENGTNNPAGRYLRFLERIGYTLSTVEKYAISAKTA